MVTEEDIKQIQEDIVDQKDTIDPQVEAHLQEMGFLWDSVQAKFSEDNSCFGCKKDLVKGEKMHVKEANNTSKGVVAFVSLCQECSDKAEKGG